VKFSFLKLILINILFAGLGHIQNATGQSDTIEVQHLNVLPKIDGVGNDMCWNDPSMEWQEINQVWMPWKGTVPSSDDFSGKYKVGWNETENLLYFLVDIIDDKFIDGYNFASNGPSGYPNYDVVEIFIDEDRSKGAHVFDNGSENAQNAFSYHFSVNAPADGETTNEFTVEDLDGVNWGNYWVVNYADHFPEFKMKKNGINYVYEFSMKVYDDAYPTQNTNGITATDKELARAILVTGKIIGMSMAYCDNDLNDGKRDHFFGSTPGKEYSANFGFMGNGYSISSENGQDIFNTCWMSANDYGVIQLLGNSTPTSTKTDIVFENVSVFPTSVSSNFQLSINSIQTGKVIVEIFDLNGLKTTEFIFRKTSSKFEESFQVEFLTRGIYFVRVRLENEIFIKKIVKQ
jgi:hypothetical protein